MQLIAFLLITAALPPAGLYEVHQMEKAGALELQPNGHFRYALSYGAVDEEGEGEWTSDGRVVRLTSNPMPRPASFELLRDDPAPNGELSMTLEDPGTSWDSPLRAIATTESNQRIEVSADDSGRVDLAGLPQIRSLAVEVPVFGPTEQHFALSADRGHRLLFRFHRNDLGRARFDRQQLRIEGGALLLDRYDTSFRFVKVQP